MKKPGAHLSGVDNHKLWCGQLCKPVPHTPVHSGHSLQVLVVVQEVEGLAVLQVNGTQTSPAPGFLPATFGKPLAEFLGVVFEAWHEDACCQDSQFIL